MPFRKKTIRMSPPLTRQYLYLLNDLESVLVRGKHLVDGLRRKELESQALQATIKKPEPPQAPVCFGCEYLDGCESDPQKLDYCPKEREKPGKEKPECSESVKTDTGTSSPF